MKTVAQCLAVAFGLLWVALPAAADEAALSGEVGAGVMFIDSGNNLNPKGSLTRIDNLDSRADRELSARFLILPEVVYAPGGQGGLQWYLSSRPPIDEIGGFTLLAGIKKRLAGTGVFDLGGFYTPFGRVWQNPYLTGVDRQESDLLRYGARAAWNKILESPFSLELVWLLNDVDQDSVAELFPELARDGSVYALNLGYSYAVSRALVLRPKISLRRGDIDGGSNAYWKVKASLQGVWRSGQWTLMPSVAYSRSSYDDPHPYFATTREEDGYSATLVADYAAPFGLDNYSLRGIAGYSLGNANIDFLGTEAINAGMALVYRF